MAAAADEGTPATIHVGAPSSSGTHGTTGGMSQDDCVAGIRSALKRTRYLTRSDGAVLEKAGCPVLPRLIHAATCASAGGYANREGIKVCCNHMTFQDEINQVAIHELIHAYDDCVAKNMDWRNCAHHACSEIRANHLSGDCH